MSPICKLVARAYPVTDLIRPPEMRRRLKVSRSTLYRWTKSGGFPPPIVINKRTVGWSEKDYSNWLNS
ncbi:helix-turn-helix transcriptional regulator [Vibrio splendidus]|uniref:helix-turn-helix transcriptional regulator n=1 Tax=Vibrio splendidus TaxID=29497 RepID=UPI000D3AF884|nr:AlpA family phage regulatory protein [Vibrio splendidus]PTP74007.1 AlpA family transcriptional regulator [Vibrio splendidus]